MEFIQQVRIVVDETKEVMHYFKEDLEEGVEEALLKRRSTTTTRTTSTGVDELAAKLHDGDIQQVLSAVINGQQVENLPEPSKREPETAAAIELEESDEEVVELEFQTAVEKMHTHNDYNMYCPNCSSRITKVFLRRKIRHRRTPVKSDNECPDLFGCLSCFSIFESLGNRLNPLRCFGAGGDHEENTPLQQEVVHEVKIPVVETPRESGIPQPPDTATGSSRSLEIVKSVVYGGLMESMASLSVVSSAAASDATTLNIVVLGLANLVGGLVVLAHNLRDLRFGDSNQTNEERYKEELGKKEHFLLHATVAVLSYIIFGLIPPATYGFTFRETNDRDFKMLAVAAASFLCIIILAIAKAHTRGQHRFTTYFKTVLYYVTSAVMVSGVAFAVGDLVEKLLERLGWLDPATVEPKSFQSTWASY